MIRAYCCQGNIADLWLIRGQKSGMHSAQIYSLKEHGVKSVIIISQALLIAANYILNSVAPD